MELYIIAGAYTIYWLIEVFHDNKLRELNILATKQDAMKVAKLSQSWHSLDWVGHAILALLTGYLASSGSLVLTPIYAVMIACLRVLILNIGLNIKAKNTKWYYLGSGKIDNLFRKVPIIYYLAVLIILVITIYLIIRL